MRSLLLAVVFAFVVPVAAQPNPTTAFPLAVGNAWEFRSEGGPLLRWDVVGERTVGGQRIALLQFNGGPTCGVAFRNENNSVDYRLVDPTTPAVACRESEASTRFPRSFVGGDGFGVSGSPAGTATFWVSGDLVTGPTWYGANGAPLRNSWSVQDGVGPMAFYRTNPDGLPTSEPTFRYILTYARVGSRTVGQSSIPGAFATYVPLAVGDRWDYSLRAGPPGGDVADGSASLTVTAVLERTPISREAQVAVVRRDAAGGETRSSCSLQVTAYTAETLGQWALCAGDAAFPYQFGVRTPVGIGPVVIGDQTYTAAQATGDDVTVQLVSGTTVTTTRAVTAAQGIGLLRWTYARTTTPQAGSDTYRSAVLGYARVGGTEYGRPVVAAEDAPDGLAGTLAAFPNPAWAQTRIRYALAGAGLARLVVTDGLGRTVRLLDLGDRLAGSGETTLDVKDLAPGVYLVRILSGTSSHALRLVVAR